MIDLERARRARGLTKSELARRAGIPVRDVRRIENTVGYDPRFSRAVALADALGVKVDDLRGDTAEAPIDDTAPTDAGRREAVGADHTGAYNRCRR